ncbi:MAG: Holliday junction branch migration protein RuvA [Rectinemataceae bacterium]|nr:Holliday junction branch migration protein RuvA [Rectinemataceae bacterium]
MFNSISGWLSEKRPDSVCVDTGGVEWEIHIPTRSLDDFGSLDSQTKVFTWLHHYEDGMRLYGFSCADDRTVFLELMKVEGIGPKQAMRIVSGIRSEALALALEDSDLTALMRIPGVGPKVAQKMMLALRGKLVRVEDSVKTSPAGGQGQGSWTDVVRALVDMGFARPSVEKSVREHSGEVPEGPDREREIFRRALIELSAGG